MAVQVFVSHTQKDVEFCDIFDRACARVGGRAFRSEFEKIEVPAWQTIRDAIRSSCALFLLVGKELVNAQASGCSLIEKFEGAKPFQNLYFPLSFEREGDRGDERNEKETLKRDTSDVGGLRSP